MQRHEPRIIVAMSNSPIVTACWLHRLGMYGPGYVLLFQSWSYFNPLWAHIPLQLQSWCSREMLADVAENTIFFGDSSKPDIFGDDQVVESTGLNFANFTAELQKRVPDVMSSDNWFYWRTMCFDQIIFIGKLVDKMESILRKGNLSPF